MTFAALEIIRFMVKMAFEAAHPATFTRECTRSLVAKARSAGTSIKEPPVPLPPADELRTIQQFLAVKHARFEKIRNELRASLRLLAERRAALITAAVTGQIGLRGENMKKEIIRGTR